MIHFQAFNINSFYLKNDTLDYLTKLTVPLLWISFNKGFPFLSEASNSQIYKPSGEAVPL